MLRGIHKASSTWLGKALMASVLGVLVISFAIWGIGDIFRGFGLNSAIKIGGTEISTEQFRQFYTQRLQQIGRQLNKAVSPEEARARGIDRQIIGQLVAEATLDQKAQDLHLGISDQDIAQRITSDPNFRGINGQFDRQRFEQIIRDAGFTEGRFVEEQRRVTLRRQIALSISGDAHVPDSVMQAINQYQNEKRSISYLSLGAAQAGDIPAPTPDELNKYFQDRKVVFRAPEYRKISILSLSPAALAKPAAVTDADAKAYYEQRKASYGTPERRDVQQIIFPNEQDAQAARDKIGKGTSFADVAKERGLKDSDVDVGMVAKSQIIDPAVADAAFALKSGEVSAPVKGQFGTVLLQVGKIEPGSQKTFEEVAQQIKTEIAQSRARNDIGTLRDKFEDERAAGSTLVEAAQKLGIQSRTIEAVDRSGRDPQGNAIPDLPRTPDVVAAAFSSDVGIDNESLQLADGGYLYYDVVGITPARDRTLDEVKDKVETSWRDDQVAKRLTAKTDDMVGKLKAGTTLDALAGESGLKVITANDLQRGRPGGFAPAKLVEAAFKTPKGVPGSAEGDQETTRFVFEVTAVNDPPLDPLAAKQLGTVLQNSYSDDLVGAYVARLESDYGVTINQQAVNQVTGAGAANSGNPND